MKFSTDKIGHGYLPRYLELLGALTGTARGECVRVCEVGVANGESLDMWQALIPRAFIIGVDNNSHALWPAGTYRVVAEQDDPQLPGRLAELTGGEPFDLIVDDASHNNRLTSKTLGLLWPLVAPGSLYVIEDWNHAGGLCAELASLLPIGAFDEAHPWLPDVESIEYRHGMIIITKTVTGAADGA